jgi:hypothetical protein
LCGPRFGQAEALQVDQVFNALRTNARIHHGDVAAHAVAHQVNRLAGSVVVQQEVEVGQVVGKPVVVGIGGAGQAKAAPVWGNDGPALRERVRQGVDHELVGRRHVHPAMHQDQRWQGRVGSAAPVLNVVAESPYRDKLAAG